VKELKQNNDNLKSNLLEIKNQNELINMKHQEIKNKSEIIDRLRNELLETNKKSYSNDYYSSNYNNEVYRFA
jgi:predicted RNase H-like nuclease (RuvC/YqgF family)